MIRERVRLTLNDILQYLQAKPADGAASAPTPIVIYDVNGEL